MEQRYTFIEKLYLQHANQQLQSDGELNIMNGLKILIVSDLAWGRALGLLAYLSEKTNAKDVQLVTNYYDAEQYVEKQNGIDILIYVGNQENHDNYHISNLVKRYKDHVLTYMYAFLDKYTIEECKKNNVTLTFHCEESLYHFAISLQSFYEITREYVTGS